MPKIKQKSKDQAKEAKNKAQDQLHALRHTAEHVLMMAMEKVYGPDKVIMAMGPATNDGFYFDFDSPEDFKLSESDFPKIEKQMKKIIQANLEMKRLELSVAVARLIFANNLYKQEWLDEIASKGETALVYLTGTKEQLASDQKLLADAVADSQAAERDSQESKPLELKSFVDLCSGPHVASTNEIKAFKLLSIAGAYWHGDEKNKMLTRVYGTAFASKEELDKCLWQKEEAEKRNHRKIGKELELFAIIPEIGQGLPVWLPRGYAMRRAIEDYMIQLERGFGYSHVLTPHIHRQELFQTSGHLDFYSESMYPPVTIDDEVYYLKPMNCPAGMMIYNLKPRSYRDLPLKMGEFGTVYRYEKSGELHGLQRVRGFTQNDAHIFCTPDQLKEQFLEVMKMLDIFYKDVGFDKYTFRLSISDPDDKKFQACGSRKDWEWAENTMREILDEAGVEYEELKGDAAFYGPKVDVQAVNVFGKEDAISTIQVDFNLPERFDINYIDKDGQKKRPFVIHRALVGSFERFFAFLIEHHAGAFPLWFSPVQVKVLPIADRHQQYAQQVFKVLLKKNIRVELDDRSERLQAKIRDAEMEKVPYMLVVGDKEVEAGSVHVRKRGSKEQESLKVEEFVGKVVEEIERRQ